MSVSIVDKINVSLLYRFFFKSGQQVAALVFGIILARILSPEEFGVVALANLVVFYANNFTNFGLNNALVQKKEVGIHHVNTVFTIDLLISFVLLIITVLGAEVIANFFNNNEMASVLKWMALYYVITTFYHIPVVLLRRSIDFKFLSIVEFLQGILTSIIAIFLALYGMSYWSIVVANLSMPAIAAIVLTVQTGWRPKLQISKEMEGIYSFGFWVFIMNQIQLIVSKVDYLIVGKYLNVHSLGIYEKSFELTDRAFSGLTMPLNAVFYSAFCRLNPNLKNVKSVFLEAAGLLALICFPLLFGLFSIAPHFVYSCLGEKWAEAVLPMQVLAASCAFRMLSGLVASVNVAIGKQRIYTLLVAISAAIFIVLCLFLIQYGLMGISLAVLFYSVILFLNGFILLFYFIELTAFELFKALWCPLAGATVMLLIILFCQSIYFTNYKSFMELIILIACGAGVYSCWGYYFYTKKVIRLSITELS